MEWTPANLDPCYATTRPAVHIQPIDPLQWVEFGAEFHTTEPSWSTAGGIAPLEILLEENLNAAFLRITFTAVP